MGETKVRSFADLEAWRSGHGLVVDIYRVTKDFPRAELLGLVGQMRRCAVSITANIAEGFSRRSPKEKIQFYSIALGSVTELQNYLAVARDVGYLKRARFDYLAQRSIIVHKLINGLIKHCQSSLHNT